MTAAAGLTRLSIQLPDCWTVRDSESTVDTMGYLLGHQAELFGKTVPPDLVATLFTPVSSDGVHLDEMLIATLMISVFRNMPVLAHEEDLLSPRHHSNIEISPGVTADFVAVSFIRRFDSISALCSFSTPNVAMIDVLHPGFEALASAIQVVPNGQ